MSCPLCEAGGSAGPLKEYRSHSILYELFHCRSCGLMFWTPPQFPEEGFYDALDFGVYQLAHGLGNRGLGGHQVSFKRHYNAKKGKLLDIGCSDGAFLVWAQDQGFDVYGIDIDTEGVERARKITDNVWPMRLDQFVCYARRRDFRFDVITMFDVLEHQPQPRQFLSDALTLLSSDGWITGTVPNRERLFKTGRTPREFCGDFPPHHFLWFDEGALKKAVGFLGLVDVRVQDQMHGYWIEETLHQLGKPFKRRFTGSATSDPLPLERLQEAGIELRQRTVRFLYGLRGLKNILKLLPKAFEAAIEITFRKGGSLYFQARSPAQPPTADRAGEGPGKHVGKFVKPAAEGSRPGNWESKLS